MKLKQKFILLAMMVGPVVLLVSAIGFYTAYTNLKEDVEPELSMTIFPECFQRETTVHLVLKSAVFILAD